MYELGGKHDLGLDTKTARLHRKPRLPTTKWNTIGCFVQTVNTEAQDKKEQDGVKRTLNNRKQGGWFVGVEGRGEHPP